MHKRILHQMRDKIRTRQYVMTVHAEEEMSDDGLTIFDVERAILTGEVVEKQQDYQSSEWKYLVTGRAVSNKLTTVVTKLSPTGKLVIVTVFLES